MTMGHKEISLTRSSHRSFVAVLAAAVWMLLALAPLRAQFGPQLYGEGFGKNKIQYRDFQWQIYHSPHFNVYFYKAEEPQLQKVVSIAESSYDQLSRAFNFQIKDPIPLIYFATHSAFEQNNVILNFIPEGVGAFASPARFRMVLPIDLADAELSQLILHELTHIFQYNMLFQGSLTRALTGGPPTWFIEGMASYMAKDETERDKMYLRDAVVNDTIPSVARSDFGGFFAYRFGHAVFDFVEERWGKEGFLDFIYEVRNTIGGRIDRAVKRAFKLDPEDFDIEFRRWLRKKYLPQLVQTGEPSDFGHVFRLERGGQETGDTLTTSPAASPGGDLVAALSAYRGKVDVVLYDAKARKLLRNLTHGYSANYQYIAAQELVLGRREGRDLSFSPDGNTIAVFAKRERGRSLLLIDVLNGGEREVIDMDDIEQQSSPAFSPDGKTVAFSGWRNGQFDIFLLDLATKTITNFTHDEIYDGGPTFSPDGRSLTFLSIVGTGHRKIFREDLDKPGVRYQLTTGDSNENDPIYSADGKRLYFTSDRKGPENIFSLDLATGRLLQYTDVVSGAYMPTLLRDPEGAGKDRLVFGGYWKQSFDLYVANVDEPIHEPQTVQIPVEPAQPKDLPRYEPDIQVTLDPANTSKYSGRKFFLEDAQSYIGVNSDQSYLGRIAFSFSDYLGNHRIFANLSSIDTLSNFDITYTDLTHRWYWQAETFDTRTYYYTGGDPLLNRGQRGRVTYQATGAVATLGYPFSFYNRAELGVGYIYRKDALPIGDPLNPDFIDFTDNFPILQGALVGDSSVFANYGAVSGHRVRLGAAYAPKGGTLFDSVDIDARQYIPVTLRSNLALRAFAGIAGGNRPTPFFFGGLDTVRGVDFRTLAGDRAFFANVEYRFPLIEAIATPLTILRGIRGVLFLDVGGAWFNQLGQSFRFYNGDTKRLQDAIASYGWGFTVNLFGLDLNWDFAKRFDLKQSGSFRSSFWIGTRF
jgi:Tol biopolymer transport system component